MAILPPRRLLWLLIFLPFGGLGGCAAPAPQARVASDLSKPKAAALTFYEAIAAGDRQTADAASLGTEQQKQWVYATIELLDGLHRYDQALLDRFGAQAIATDVDLKQAISTLSQDPILRLRDAIVRESDQQAVIYPAMGTIRLMSRPPVYLKRVDRKWKVDLPEMSRDSGPDPSAVKQYRAAARALHQAAREVAAGKYPSFDQAVESVKMDLPDPSGGPGR